MFSCHQWTKLRIRSSKADTTAVGRLGEWLVYETLLKKFAEQVKEGDVEIIWMNKDAQTTLPYDIQIINRGNTENSKDVKFVEVKATWENEDKAFEMSSYELRHAFEFGQRYDVYRVVGVGSCESFWIKHLPGFERYLDTETAGVYIALKD